MSFESKKLTKEVTLEDELNKVAYHDLKEEFEKRGVLDSWSAGTKKVELIKRAIEQINSIKKENKVEEEKAKEKEATEKPIKEKVHPRGHVIMYDLLKKRHFKDESLDTLAVKASLKKYEEKVGNPRLLSYQIDAHKRILKDLS